MPQSRLAITEAVEKLMTEHRLDELTVAEIVEAAGVSRATFYVHFETKFSVVAALLEDVVDDIFTSWGPLFDGEGPIAERDVRRYVTVALQRWRRHAALMAAAHEAWHTDPEIHKIWGAWQERFAAALAVRIERSGIDVDVHVHQLATVLLAIVERSAYLAVSTPESVLSRSDESLAEVIAAVWVRSVRGTT